MAGLTMDLPNTLNAVLSEIVAECEREYRRVYNMSGAQPSEIAQAWITLLVAQKDLLEYRERTAHQGRDNGAVEAAVLSAIKDERARCAKIAFDMQDKINGSSSIGCAIQDQR